MSGNAAKTMWIAADNPEEPPIGLLGDPEREAHTVYVGNINRETPNEKIRELLTEAGTLVDFKMVWDRNTGLRTYGFAQYKVSFCISCKLTLDLGYRISAESNRNAELT